MCAQTAVTAIAKQTQEMIRMSATAFAGRDVVLARKIPRMDDSVDEGYRENLRKVMKQKGDLKCLLSATLFSDIWRGSPTMPPTSGSRSTTSLQG